MSELVDRIVANIVRLEVRLLACQARLEADTDPGGPARPAHHCAPLSTLLQPLRGLRGCAT